MKYKYNLYIDLKWIQDKAAILIKASKPLIHKHKPKTDQFSNVYLWMFDIVNSPTGYHSYVEISGWNITHECILACNGEKCNSVNFELTKLEVAIILYI